MRWVAARFSVSIAFVGLLCAASASSGRVGGPAHESGGLVRLDAMVDLFGGLSRWQSFDATLAELAPPCRRRRPAPEPNEVWRAVERPRVGRKSVHAAERDTERVVALRHLF
jgi:hypothetical protein